MNTEVLIDYSTPCMAAERALKDLHNHMLAGEYEKAMRAAIEAMTDVRLTYQSISHMKEQRDALRKQTPPVR